MPSLPLYNLEKTKVGTVDLDDSIFAAQIHPLLIQDAVRAQIARRHEYKTANTLTRSEVTGTGKKMYRQKGTGQARHGDAKANILAGGGVAHGPKPRRVIYKINKKVARSALVSALSLLQKEDRMFVVDKMELEKFSTKQVAQCQSAFDLDQVLFVNTDEEVKEKQFNLSSRNLKHTKLLKPEGVNVFDLLKYKNVLLSQTAAKKLTDRLKGEGKND